MTTPVVQGCGIADAMLRVRDSMPACLLYVEGKGREGLGGENDTGTNERDFVPLRPTFGFGARENRGRPGP